MLGRRPSLRAAIACAAAWLLHAPLAHAGSPYLEVPPADELVASPAYRYANMTNDEAYAELDRRGVPYVREGVVAGVRAPVRLSGALHGVDIHSSLPPDQRADTVFEILDARLALSLDDFCVVLARHDVNELVHYTMYRPNVPAPGTFVATKAGARKGDAKTAEAKTADAKADPKGKTARGKKDAHPAGKRRASLDGKAQKEHARRSGAESVKNKDLAFEEKPLVVWGEVDDLAKGAPGAGAKGAAPSKSATPSKSGATKKAAQPASTDRRGGASSRADAPQGKARSGKSAKKRILMTTNEEPHGRWAPPGTRHPAGLAIDVGILKKIDGTYLNVAQHFHGKIGDKTCGEGVPEADTKEARELRAIVCETHDAGIFTYALTPNFNADHADHFHLEIKPGVRWFLYH